jgi:hypothetical protein
MGNIIFDLFEVWTSETENKQHREFSNILPTKQTSMALSFLFFFLNSSTNDLCGGWSVLSKIWPLSTWDWNHHQHEKFSNYSSSSTRARAMNEYPVGALLIGLLECLFSPTLQNKFQSIDILYPHTKSCKVMLSSTWIYIYLYIDSFLLSSSQLHFWQQPCGALRTSINPMKQICRRCTDLGITW